MRDDEFDEWFEWDHGKAMRARVDPEKVSFEDARLVFRDPFGVGYLDDREDYGDAVLVVRIPATESPIPAYRTDGSRGSGHGALVLEHHFSGSEERWIRIGIVQIGEEQKIVTVIYTEREGRRRIITNWIATKDEQDDYCQQNMIDW